MTTKDLQERNTRVARSISYGLSELAREIDSTERNLRSLRARYTHIRADVSLGYYGSQTMQAFVTEEDAESLREESDNEWTSREIRRMIELDGHVI